MRVPLITALRDMGVVVRVYDPVGMEQAKAVINNITCCNDAYARAKNATALVIVPDGSSSARSISAG